MVISSFRKKMPNRKRAEEALKEAYDNLQSQSEGASGCQ